MSDLALPASSARLVRGGVSRRLLCLALLVPLADWLWFDGPVGAGITVLDLGILAAACCTVPHRPAFARVAVAWLVGMLAQIPWLLDANILDFCLAFLGLAIAVAVLTPFAATPWGQSVRILAGMFWRIWPDLFRAGQRLQLNQAGAWNAATILGWLLPLFGGALFVSLFADANPIIAAILKSFSPVTLFQALSVSRVMFWLFIAAAAWPFLAPPNATNFRLKIRQPLSAGIWQILFGPLAIRRALILFNILFAIQTALDATYLLAGAKLPAGLTFADYAHRGAYTLVFTALLAGVFAILATRPGSPAAASRGIRLLVLAWVGQNLILVAASIFRLRLYVQAYGLSQLRLAALIWMLLVFAGLSLIILRIITARSDGWLLRANALAGLATLYFALCLNFPGIVAQYDVTHCKEVSGSGAPLDLDYLQSLGPQAIPALDRYQILTAHGATKPFAQQGPAGTVRGTLASDFIDGQPEDWRGFTFRSWQLSAYLATHNPSHYAPD